MSWGALKSIMSPAVLHIFPSHLAVNIKAVGLKYWGTKYEQPCWLTHHIPKGCLKFLPVTSADFIWPTSKLFCYWNVCPLSSLLAHWRYWNVYHCSILNCLEAFLYLMLRSVLNNVFNYSGKITVKSLDPMKFLMMKFSHYFLFPVLLRYSTSP